MSKKSDFVKDATAYLEKLKAAWLEDIMGSPIEPHADAYARREDWLLPNETLADAPLGKMFPSADARDWANHIEQDGRDKASRMLAQAAKADMSEFNTSIQRLKEGLLPSKPANTPEKPQDAPSAIPGPVRAIPEGVTQRAVVLYQSIFNGVRCYTYDRDMMQTIQAAQVQKVTLAVESEEGDHGQHILSLKPTDPLTA